MKHLALLHPLLVCALTACGTTDQSPATLASSDGSETIDPAANNGTAGSPQSSTATATSGGDPAATSPVSASGGGLGQVATTSTPVAEIGTAGNANNTLGVGGMASSANGGATTVDSTGPGGSGGVSTIETTQVDMYQSEVGGSNNAATGAGGSGGAAPIDSVDDETNTQTASESWDSRFELAWEDNFDSVDTSRWNAQTHSWDGNLAQFTADNVVAESGLLKLNLTRADDVEKPFRGVEYRSVDTLTFGKVEASVRFAKGSGVVSALVLIYTPWPPDDWNELDIECLGNTTGQVQFNHMINIPPADPESGHLQFPQLVDLGFDPSADFHTYAVEWVPGEARFVVDGVVVHRATEEVSRMRLPQNVLLTIWASDAADWAGPIDMSTAPTSAEYDWVRVYRYVEP